MSEATKKIFYRAGYKYQLAERYTAMIGNKPKVHVCTKFITLEKCGYLHIQVGYAWDGASGPVRDVPGVMRASLVHDALYQLMRMRKLSARNWRKKADLLFRRMCIEDGVPRALADVYYLGLRLGGALSANPRNAKPIIEAPCSANYAIVEDDQ